MKINTMHYRIAFLVALVLPILFASVALALTIPQVQTNAATNVQNNSATLNGNLFNLGGDYAATVWFQYGVTSSYGYETNHMTQNYTGSFSQIVYNLAPNTSYHFRAVAQNGYSIAYGQDMLFTVGNSGSSQVVANAGPTVYITSGQSATLQGLGYDTYGSPVNYSWSCTGGSLSNYNIAQPTYAAPYSSGQTSYTCTLTVSNNSGSSNSASATIYVNYSGTGNFSVQTNAATNAYNSQAVLNGAVSGGSYPTLGWFQWGTSTGYGNTTNQQQVSSGSFTQTITNLSANATYHYRAVAQNSNGQIVYGQDMTFLTNGGQGYGSGTITLNTSVINLSSGNLNWLNSASASPSDILKFLITLQTNGQDVHNVFVRDSLPGGLNYYNNLVVNGSSNYSGSDITSGITFNTIPAGQYVTIMYQAQAVPVQNIGAVTLNNTATVTSTEAGTQSSNVTLLINNSLLSQATSVSTGLTNDFFTDSFFLPLMLCIGGILVYASGLFGLRKKHKKTE